jgi:hypothetical protein
MPQSWDMVQIILLPYLLFYCLYCGHAVAQWLRHCATNQKVAGLIPDGVGFFHWHNPSGRTMALGSTQPLTEMISSNISWGKVGRCIGLTILTPSCADWIKIWEPQPPGILRACPGLLWDYFIFVFDLRSEFWPFKSRPGIESRLVRDFPHLSRPNLGPIQHPVEWVPGLSRG